MRAGRRRQVASSRSQGGQASVEAALILPSVMLLLALLLEPACLLYTRCVMEGAAASTARVLATRSEGAGGTDEACRAFCLRRLAAVPDVSVFHVGGSEDWEVTLEGKEGSSEVSVEIVGHVRPLPLMGLAASAFGESDGEGVVLRVKVSERARPKWLGGDYDDWVGAWGS